MPANNSPYLTFTDQDLIRLLKVSSHAAYTEIYNRYYRLMIAFAYKKLQDEDLTKDLVQELFVMLWQKREGLMEGGNLSAYLYICLRGRILNYFEQRNVRTKYLEVLARVMEEAATESSDELVREKTMSAYIDLQIEALPKKMRAVFEMSRKGHLSHKEIAVILGTSEDNVSKHITSALKSLRTKLTSLFL